jgi:hypothetical protein
MLTELVLYCAYDSSQPVSFFVVTCVTNEEAFNSNDDPLSYQIRGSYTCPHGYTTNNLLSTPHSDIYSLGASEDSESPMNQSASCHATLNHTILSLYIIIILCCDGRVSHLGKKKSERTSHFRKNKSLLSK